MDRIAALASEWERAKAGTRDYLDSIGAENHAHHRGQVTVYFRLPGITPRVSVSSEARSHVTEEAGL